MHAWLMASVIHNGSVNLLSGWCGFWDTSSHFHVGVFLILPLFLNHVSTWSRASNPLNPRTQGNRLQHTQHPGWEHWPFANYVALSVTHTHLLLETFPQLVISFALVSKQNSYQWHSVILDYSRIRSIPLIHFWIRFWISGMTFYVNIQPCSHYTIEFFKCPSIFINNEKKIVKHHLYLFFFLLLLLFLIKQSEFYFWKI